MAAGVGVFLAITGLSSYSEGLRLHQVPSVSAMAISMAVPMAGWMLVRGHGWRNSAEMAAAMIVPAAPFVILAGLGVISGTACRAYMPLSIVAMIGLMVYRRAAYSMPNASPVAWAPAAVASLGAACASNARASTHVQGGRT